MSNPELPLPLAFTIDENSSLVWSGYARQYQSRNTFKLGAFLETGFADIPSNPFRVIEDINGNIYLRGSILDQNGGSGFLSEGVLDLNNITATSPALARIIERMATASPVNVFTLRPDTTSAILSWQTSGPQLSRVIPTGVTLGAGLPMDVTITLFQNNA